MEKSNKTHVPTVEKLSAVEQRLKKSVGAIHSSGNLTLVQRKLANVLLYSAYDTLLSKRTHTVPVSIMCSMLGWDASNRIDHLKEALLALQQTTIQFNLREEGHEVWESMTMLSYAQIKNGICTYRYDEALAEKLYDPAMFAMINLKVQRQLDTAYALNLYENLYRFRNTNQGSTGEWSLEFFREIIGATASYYDDYRELNRKIIKPSLEKINKDTDIEATVETVKKSRQVVGLKFFVHEKTEDEKNAMPSTLPGTSAKEGIDAFAEVRDTAAFKALRKHGVTERLAFAWIREKGEQTVLDMVAYTEERDAKNLINTNTRAYMQSLVKAGAEFGQSDYDKEKTEVIEAKTKAAQTEAQKNRLAELEAEFRTIRIKEARNALTLEERSAHARAWLQTEAGQGKDANFDMGKGRFKDSVTNIQFEQVYLSKVVATPHTQTEFKAWLKERKNLDPVKLGLNS
jgi:plasmid replication initiation protein